MNSPKTVLLRVKIYVPCRDWQRLLNMNIEINVGLHPVSSKILFENLLPARYVYTISIYTSLIFSKSFFYMEPSNLFIYNYDL